jgi:hypothetical protein
MPKEERKYVKKLLTLLNERNSKNSNFDKTEIDS